MKINLETIRNVYIMIGTLLTTLNLPFIPEVITNLFSPEGQVLVFDVLQLAFTLWTAAVTLYQFSAKRKGNTEGPQPLSTNDISSPARYLLPFSKAA